MSKVTDPEEYLHVKISVENSDEILEYDILKCHGELSVTQGYSAYRFYLELDAHKANSEGAIYTLKRTPKIEGIDKKIQEKLKELNELYMKRNEVADDE